MDQIHMLLVEDNPGDVLLTKEALRDSKIRNNMTVVGTGEMALDFLYRRGDYEDATPVDLILLDLNLPGVDGYEVLEVIKQDEKLRRVPVVVLTSSAAESDRLKSYNLHANCFVTKPLAAEAFYSIVRQIEQFWLKIVGLPPR